ncbi:hypothetical protein [Halorubellus sp. PRR65]|uniref:hypothetical protein n=1 Tax=Halorubellus sp. PRR65 TaxID=3098148 RepID=UPI002B263911|nr:hypothetical protein [Halorubellus sp. PRR65]
MTLDRLNRVTLLFVIGLVVLAPPITGLTAATHTSTNSSGLDVSLTLPSQPTAGEQTTIGASATVPDLVGSYETELTFTLLVDGNSVSEQTVTVADGDTTQTTFTHTFANSGSHEVRVTAGTEIAGQSFNAGVTKTLSVESQSTTTPDIGSLELSTSAPSTTTVDQSTTITSTVSLPTISGTTVSGDVTVALKADGRTVASKTITLSDGDSKEVSLSHAFTSSGETKLTVSATGTIADQSVSASTSRTITVESQTETIDTTGVVFKTPTSLEDEVESYRSQLGLDGSMNAFVLATQDSLTLVFTTTTPKKGIASVQGQGTDAALSYQDFTLDVAIATSVSYDQTGRDATVQAIQDTPDDYRLDLVRVSTEYRRVSVLTDPDQGDDVTASTTIGALVANPKSATSLYEDSTKQARTLAQYPNATTAKRVLQNPEAPYLPTFTFENQYWASAPATVDGVVLNPSSRAYEFATTLDTTGLISYADERDAPSLYVVDSQFQSKQYNSVSAITSNAADLDGNEVTITGRVYQTRVSVQETAEHATTTQCSEDMLTVQTPNGPACVNVAVDVLADGGIMWTTVPETRDDVLPVIGLSATHQDTPLTEESGRYKLTGELVSTSRINESLPEGSILVIHETERVGDIDYQTVATEARTLIEERATHLQAYHQRSAGKPLSQQSTPQPTTTTTTTTAPTISSTTTHTTSTTTTLADQSTSAAPSTQPETKQTQSTTETNPSDSPQEPGNGDGPLEDSPVPGFTLLPAILAILFIAARRT